MAYKDSPSYGLDLLNYMEKVAVELKGNEFEFVEMQADKLIEIINRRDIEEIRVPGENEIISYVLYLGCDDVAFGKVHLIERFPDDPFCFVCGSLDHTTEYHIEHDDEFDETFEKFTVNQLIEVLDNLRGKQLFVRFSN